MKKRLRGFVFGLLVGMVIAGGTALAVNSTTLYNVITSGINIIIDGNKFVPKDANGNVVEPMIYNGTTYLPVRAIANAFDKKVSWDGTTQTVYLGEMAKGDSKDICVMKSTIMKIEDSDGNILTETTEYSYDEVAELSNGVIVIYGKAKKTDGTTMPIQIAYTKDGIAVAKREFDGNNITDWSACLENRTLASFEKQSGFSYIEKLTNTSSNEQYKVHFSDGSYSVCVINNDLIVKCDEYSKDGICIMSCTDNIYNLNESVKINSDSDNDFEIEVETQVEMKSFKINDTE